MHYWNTEERDENLKKYKTAVYDPRFPNTNQAKRCWINYVDYWKCANVKGDDNPICEEFKFVFNEICPNVWIEKWNEQRENGTFPVRDLNIGEPKF